MPVFYCPACGHGHEKFNWEETEIGIQMTVHCLRCRIQVVGVIQMPEIFLDVPLLRM